MRVPLVSWPRNSPSCHWQLHCDVSHLSSLWFADADAELIISRTVPFGYKSVRFSVFDLLVASTMLFIALPKVARASLIGSRTLAYWFAGSLI
eukprot:SAG31_NODE_18326_length_640_cov_0.953789_1_plen_93_part_00